MYALEIAQAYIVMLMSWLKVILKNQVCASLGQCTSDLISPYKYYNLYTYTFMHVYIHILINKIICT